ncbi:MAG: hypothetical protein ACE5LQ_03435, partial [Candidatus Bipolaricaulia bacterium]
EDCFLDKETGKVVMIPVEGGDVLARYPDERERWFELKEEYLRREAEDWLQSLGVEPKEAQ